MSQVSYSCPCIFVIQFAASGVLLGLFRGATVIWESPMVDLKRLQVSKTRSLIVTRHFVRRGVGVMDGSCGSSVEASHVLYTMSFTVTRHGACWLVIVACGGSWSWAWVAPRKKVNTATLSEARRKYILASLN